MYQLKRNQTQLITFVLIDSLGTPKTGLGNGFSLSLSKAGAAFVAGGGVKAEIGLGWYSYQLPAGETDTVGPLAVAASGVGTIQQNLMYVVESYVVGSSQLHYTLTTQGTGVPIAGATIYISSDIAGLVVIWNGTTDGLGVARDNNGELPQLFPGTYYVWRLKYGYTFTDPDIEVVT